MTIREVLLIDTALVLLNVWTLVGTHGSHFFNGLSTGVILGCAYWAVQIERERKARRSTFSIPKNYRFYEHGIANHLVAFPAKSEPFVWCPISGRMSFSMGDIEHKYCAGCGRFFSEVTQ